MHIQELDTPALIIDLAKMEANIERMASLARERGIALRPHTKTHKSPDIAKLQVKAGASGITCAKVGEAEVMAAAGLDDILIANEIIGATKYHRLTKLARQARLCIGVDSEFGVRSLNEAFEQAQASLDVMIEVNCGQNRSGLLPREPVLKLAKVVKDCSALKLRGIFTHGGHAYSQDSREVIEQIGLEEGRVMVETADLLRENGIAVDSVSVGSTPTAPYCSAVKGVTELRPGTYIFCDLTEVDLFACDIDQCALSVLATVTSLPASNRVILDAGKKALTSDPRGRTAGTQGFGFLPDKKVTIARLSEEHGVIETDVPFKIGEKVQILPNHACVVVNMFDRLVGVRDGLVEREFEIAARGKMR